MAVMIGGVNIVVSGGLYAKDGKCLIPGIPGTGRLGNTVVGWVPRQRRKSRKGYIDTRSGKKGDTYMSGNRRRVIHAPGLVVFP